MPNKPIEDQLRKRLSQHSTPIDVDMLWAKVEPRLPKKKRRILPFWAWLIVGFALSLTLLLQLPKEDNSTPLALVSDIPLAAPRTEKAALLPEVDDSSPPPKSPVATTQSTAVDDFISKPAPVIKAPLPNESVLAPSAPVMEQEAQMVYAKMETPALEINTSHPTLTQDASVKSGSITQPRPLLSEAQLILIKESDTVVDPTAPMDAPAAPAVKEVKPEVDAIIATPKKTIAETDRQAQDAEVFTEQPQKQGQADQQLISANTSDVQKAETELAQSKEEEEEEEAIKPNKIIVKKPAFWTVEPGIALSLPSSYSSGEDSPGSEKALEGISLQGLVGYHRASGLSIRTGLVMSLINSRLQAEITRVGSQSQEAVVTIIENANGSLYEQLGTIELATEETTTSEFYNSVNSLDIPLLVGYRFSGNKWGLMVEAGPTFNLSSGGEAHRYNDTGFAVVGDNYFRQKLKGQGFLANFGGTYGLTKKTSLIANLRFQSFGNSGFENPETSSSSTNYSLFGIQVGYRICF